VACKLVIFATNSDCRRMGFSVNNLAENDVSSGPASRLP
jgi:hypothetical protein